MASINERILHEVGFCTRMGQNAARKMTVFVVVIISLNIACCHLEFTSSDQIEATLVAGEKMYILVSCTSTWPPKVPMTFSDRVSCWKRTMKNSWELVFVGPVLQRWTELSHLIAIEKFWSYLPQIPNRIGSWPIKAYCWQLRCNISSLWTTVP